MNLTESEKNRILKMHTKNGYKTSINEMEDEPYFAKHEKSPSWTGGKTSKNYKDVEFGDDFEDEESYDDYKTALDKYPDIPKLYGKYNYDDRRDSNDFSKSFNVHKTGLGPLKVRKRKM